MSRTPLSLAGKTHFAGRVTKVQFSLAPACLLAATSAPTARGSTSPIMACASIAKAGVARSSSTGYGDLSGAQIERKPPSPTRPSSVALQAPLPL